MKKNVHGTFRTKWKRQASVGMDLLHDAGNMAAVQQLLRTNPYWANYLSQNTSMFGASNNRPVFNSLVVPTSSMIPASNSQNSLLQFLASQNVKDDISSPKESPSVSPDSVKNASVSKKESDEDE